MTIRADGRAVHDIYLYQVKAPSESHGPYDDYKLLATIPGDQAFRPLTEGGMSASGSEIARCKKIPQVNCAIRYDETN